MTMTARTRRGIAALGTATAAWAASAAAALAADTDGTTNTIGSGLQGALENAFGPILFAVSGLSFVAGLYFLVRGLMRLTTASHDRNELGPAFAAIVGAVMLIGLPEIAGVGISSLFDGSSMIGSAELTKVQGAYDSGSSTASDGISKTLVGNLQVSGVTACLSGASGTDTADNAVTCMAGNLAKNAVPMAIIAVMVFTFLAGLVTLASCIVELSRGENGGQRGPGFWMKAAMGVLLMNGSVLFVLCTNTLFGSGTNVIGNTGLNSSSNFLTYTGNLSGSFQAYGQLIGYCFVILALFGYLAFAKGLMTLKGAAEGKGQATYTAGLTFGVAGVLLANAKAATCVAMTTVAGASASVAGFCN